MAKKNEGVQPPENKPESKGAQPPEEKPQKVTVILPSDPLVRDSNGNVGEQQRFFSVNGKNYLVKCDEPVEVDPEIAEVIRFIKEMKKEARQYVKETVFRDSVPPKG